MATRIWKEKGDRHGMYWRGQNMSLQHKPYRTPLPYEVREGRWISRPSDGDIRNGIPLANGFLDHARPAIVGSSNKALDKLYEKLSQSESLLVAWKERQSALDLVASNVRRLVTIARAVKRRDPRVVRQVLKRNPEARDVVKTPAGLWLEYHFAIVPTIMDIHHAAGVLGFEFPVEKLSFSSKATHNFVKGGDRYDWYYNERFTVITKLQGEIYGLNPDIHLASMLGFGQPLSVAWEMTPFSWFVDYFVNVGQLVTNLQPRFPAVKTRNHTTTTLITCNGSSGYRNSEPPGQFPQYPFESMYMSRALSWPNYQLEFKSPFDLKGQQCSYIVAVLVGLLGDIGRKK